MIWLTLFGCTEFKSLVMSVWPIDYTAPTVEASVDQTSVVVSPVLSDFPQITDVAFFQNAPDTLPFLDPKGGGSRMG